MVTSQRDVSLNSSSNARGTLSQGEKIDSKSDEMVERTKAAGKATDFNNVIEEFDNGTDDTILNRDARSLNEPTKIGKNDISNGKNSSNINNSQVFARVFYASIVKQPNRLTRPSNIPTYVLPRVSPLKLKHSSILNDLTQGDE